MKTENLDGKVGVVTGAASGIGRATALEMARRGADIAMCDVDGTGLKETAMAIGDMGRRTYTQEVDVTQADRVQSFADATYETLGRADILVNNAGIATGGELLDVPLEEFRRVVEINLMGVVHGCYAFLPRMRDAGGRTHVVNIASLAGLWAGPGMASYFATKFGVVGFSCSLSDELEKYNIGVTAICPGVIDTEIVRSARTFGEAATEEVREQGLQFFKKRGYTPERVALKIMKAVQKGRVVAPVSPEAWLGYYVQRIAPWFPRWVGRKISASA